MMTWVLILWIVTGAGGGALDHIEFKDQQSCEDAIKAIPANTWTGGPIRAVCVERPLPPMFGVKP